MDGAEHDAVVVPHHHEGKYIIIIFPVHRAFHISNMHVKKRDGSLEEVSFDKVLHRISELSSDLKVNAIKVAQKVVGGLYDGVSTSELDRLAAETSSSMIMRHPDYDTLAMRLEVSNLHKMTLYASCFSTYVSIAGDLLSDGLRDVVERNQSVIDSAIVEQRDFDFTYFGFKTLQRSYLMRSRDGQVIERPQHMWMRVAIGIHGGDIESVLRTYEDLSSQLYVHATPTLFNAGTPKPQCSSCFLLQTKEDSIEGIFDTLKRCACISKYAGGIGLSIHDVRSKGSHIKGTNGSSNGIVPMLQIFNACSRYVDQGGGKRKGSIAIYLEPWHADVLEFLDLKKNHGKEESRARDLFYGLWTSDLFMRRVKANEDWSLFCPNECPGLSECHGDEFAALYERYEAEGRAKKKLRAQKLWYAIVESQLETGTPYILFKDACNERSNQRHLGTIKSSNLCTEIVEYTSPDETAVCNLASINLKKFVRDGAYDFERLEKVAGRVTKNLNRVIDVNFYPIESARRSNFRHRPIGIGVQGLADVFMMMGVPYDSGEARTINQKIFESIYIGALDMSCSLAERDGPYETYDGSPMSEGKLCNDLWSQPDFRDTTALRERIKRFGVRNSLLVAPMPTASTSQILGNNECFEPYTTNLYTRRTSAGDFVVLNRHLVRTLMELGMWNARIRNHLVENEGSIATCAEIPQEVRDLYKTAWEIKQKCIIDMARDRAPFVCQSQSMNLFMAEPTFSKVTSMLFYAWKQKLKTGMYYLRRKAKATALKDLGFSSEGTLACEMCGS